MTTTEHRPDVPELGDPRLDRDAGLDVAHLQRVLLGHYADLRLGARRLMADPRFHKRDDLTLAEHRERVLGQLRLLAAEGDVHRSFPERFAGDGVRVSVGEPEATDLFLEVAAESHPR